MKTLLILIFGAIILVSCQKSDEKEEPPVNQFAIDIQNAAQVIKETYQTEWNQADNVDSPAFWKGDDGEALLIATAKEAHKLIVYDATNGRRIKLVGRLGDGELEFNRPNGIWVWGDYIFVVERDNARVQILKAPEFKFIGFLGRRQLVRPYGISVIEYRDKNIAYVTDQIEPEEEPAEDEEDVFIKLGERVKMFTFDIDEDVLDYTMIKKFGDSTGDGVLKVVESIYADPENDNLIIAEEYEPETQLKVFDLYGKYKGVSFGRKYFAAQSEGIALYDCGGGKGYWITTDQDSAKTTFHFFDRKTFEHKAVFIPQVTANTDGIWLTQTPFQGFPEGCFFAVHDDGGISAFDIREIQSLLNLKCE